MLEINLDNVKRVHMVGIGGIGVSAMARLMLARGVSVSGSDCAPSLITEKLKQEGAGIFIGHNVAHVPEVCDMVVYSPAVLDDNPEFAVARERGIPTRSYPEALGMVSRGMRTIAVSGTHGKTTTTAMIAEVLMDANRSPTVVVGSLLKGSGSNFISGTSDLFVVEACEYKRSFLSLSPEILVITNINNDHLDYYGNIEGVQKAFGELVEKVPAYGAIVCDPRDPQVAPALKNAVARIVDYTEELLTIELTVHGEHNKKNAKVALAVARLLGVKADDAMRFVSRFEGTWRRMEYKGKLSIGALVYDDYAHHPTEIQATLQGFREKYPTERIRVVFQPHLYSRTKLLLNGFAQSFRDADEVVVASIYAAREKADMEITSEKLVHAIRVYHKNVRALVEFPMIETYIRTTAQKDDIIITMGAGDIYKIGDVLVPDSSI